MLTVVWLILTFLMYLEGLGVFWFAANLVRLSGLKVVIGALFWPFLFPLLLVKIYREVAPSLDLLKSLL